MAIVEIKTTVSIRYYEKKRKSDIIHAIHMMCDQLKLPRPATAELLDKTNRDLAWVAIRLHDQFPE